MRIAHVQPALSTRRIGCGVQINEFALRGQRLESMREPLGDQQTLMILRGENIGIPAEECWRTTTDVHGNIINLAFEATDNLGFGMWWILKMQTAHSAFFPRKCVIDLRNRLPQPCFTEVLGTIKTAEKPPVILNGLALDNGEAGNGRRGEFKT